MPALRPSRPILAVVTILPLLLPGAQVHAQQVGLPAPVRAAADAITPERIRSDLEFLSSDALRGRFTPSPGYDSAAAFIARRLERAGLKPLGDDGTYFQHYDLREERLDTAAAYLEIGGRRFDFGDDFLMRSFAGPLDGTLPVVYVGHGWTVPGEGIDPYAGVDVRGKVVLVDGFDAPADVEIQQIGRIFANAGTPYLEAQRRGAAGIIFIAPTPALTGWDGLRRSNISRLEIDPIVPSAYAAVPITSLLIRPHVADALLAGERAVVEPDTPSFQLRKTVTVHVPLASSVVHRPYNVVALVEGSDPELKDEYITIASHLDGAVGRSALDGDSIYNAADDNASGSSATLSIAEQLMRGPRPKRSIMFIWDSGEERGLWGTRRFVDEPPVPLEDIVAHMNIDMLGASRAPGSPDSADERVTGPREVYLTGPAVLSAGLDSLLQRVNRSYENLGLNRLRDRADAEAFYPRTDAGPFLERGVLAMSFGTGLHERYHRPTDEAQYLDPAKIAAIARTIYVMLWTLADVAVPPRIDKAMPELVPRYR